MAVDTVWTSPAASGDLDLATGEIVTEAIWDKVISDLGHLGGTTGSVSTRVYNDANISIANNSITALTFNQERFDTETLHSTVSNTSRLRCNLAGGHAGKYAIFGTVTFNAHATGYRGLYIRLNGTTNIAAAFQTALNGQVTAMTISTIYALAESDYVELMAYQNSGGALDVLVLANYSPEFGMVKV